MKLTTALAVAAAGITPIASAQTERDLDSHEHGAAIMNIAIDEDSVFIELESPWNNLVGFEHTPKTDEQHELVDNALALLNLPEQLFSFVGTQCVVAEMMVENSLNMKDGEHHGDEHGHDEHEADKHDDDHSDEHDAEKHDDDHSDEHDADKHDEHDAEGHDDHDDHEGEGSSHAEVLVEYSFTCNEIAKLSAIDVVLLEVWSGFEELDVQLIGPGGQALEELTPTQTRVDTAKIQ